METKAFMSKLPCLKPEENPIVNPLENSSCSSVNWVAETDCSKSHTIYIRKLCILSPRCETL